MKVEVKVMSDFVLLILISLGVVLPAVIAMVCVVKNRRLLGVVGYALALTYTGGTWGLANDHHPEWWEHGQAIIVVPVVCGILMGIVGGIILLTNDA